MLRSTWLGRAPATSRNPHWDNIRYISGTLIVLIHMTAPLLEFTAIRWIYIATWAFRVPTFAMIAGYFSTAGPLNGRDTRRLVESVLVPYLLLGIAHSAQLRYYSGEWDFYVENPAHALWFLLALLFWRMMLPYVARLRYPLGIAVLAALAAGYLEHIGYMFAASHTIALLPFFLLGWKLREGWARRALDARWSFHAALGVVGTVSVLAFVYLRDIETVWLGMLGPYAKENFPVDLEWAWVMRAAVLLFGFVAALSLIRLVPKRRLPLISYLGSGGFYMYLLHPLVVRAWMESGPGVDWVDTKAEQILMIALSVLLATALASPPVRALTRPVIQPRLPWLFTADPERSRTSARG